MDVPGGNTLKHVVNDAVITSTEAAMPPTGTPVIGDFHDGSGASEGFDSLGTYTQVEGSSLGTGTQVEGSSLGTGTQVEGNYVTATKNGGITDVGDSDDDDAEQFSVIEPFGGLSDHKESEEVAWQESVRQEKQQQQESCKRSSDQVQQDNDGLRAAGGLEGGGGRKRKKVAGEGSQQQSRRQQNTAGDTEEGDEATHQQQQQQQQRLKVSGSVGQKCSICQNDFPDTIR
jgi:hypothetical protein